MVKLLVAGTFLIKRSKFSTDYIKVSTLYWILNVKYHFSINGWNIEIKIWWNLCLISTEGIETKNSLCSLDSNWAEFSYMRSIMALSGWRTETNVRHVSHGILLRTRVTCSEWLHQSPPPVVPGLVMNILGGIIYTYIKHLERAGARRRQSLETGPPQSHDLGSKRTRYEQLWGVFECLNPLLNLGNINSSFNLQATIHY